MSTGLACVLGGWGGGGKGRIENMGCKKKKGGGGGKRERETINITDSARSQHDVQDTQLFICGKIR